MALQTLHTSTLQLPPSTPLPNYIFNVAFYYYKGLKNERGFTLDNDNKISMVAVQVDLPTFETKLVTKKFFGSEKSYPVYRSNAGETSLVFYAHAQPKENDFIVSNFFKKYEERINNEYVHYERFQTFDKIVISVGLRAGGPESYKYTLRNCLVTKIDQGQLSYEGSEAIKYTMSVHYDDWYIEEFTIDDKNKNAGTNKTASVKAASK
jgi:hypothetical protein